LIRLCRLLPLLPLALLPVRAEFTFIDATPANTTLNSAPVTAPDGVALVAGTNYVAGTGNGTDGRWSYRTDVASFEGGGYFESDAGTPAAGDPGGLKNDREATADLITTLTLPAAGTYEIVVLFTRLNNRDISARLGGSPQDPADIFHSGNADEADQSLDPRKIAFDSSYQNTRGTNAGAARLGQVTTTVPNQTVRVFVNGFGRTAATDDERTQYDGVAYQPAVPAAPVHYDVFLIAGQSNADGRGLKAELTGPLAGFAGAQPAVRIHYTNLGYVNADQSRHGRWVTLEPGLSVPPGHTGALPSTTFGMEIGAGKILARHYAHPAFIKVTRGGTALGVPGSDWYPAPLDSPDVGPLYQSLISATRAALGAITAAGDSFTVHALFWHQGESDTGRQSQYAGLLRTLIDCVRHDLELPNLRFLVGELADSKPQAFRDLQWQVAREAHHAGFISSRGLPTFEGTHFTTQAMVDFGGRLAETFLLNHRVVDFEAPLFAPGALDRQGEFAVSGGGNGQTQVVATVPQGDYPGGQAVGLVGAGEGENFSRRQVVPLASARSLQADFFPGDTGYDNQADADSVLLVAGWAADPDGDGHFTAAETAVGCGLDASGTFVIQLWARTHPATPFVYQVDRWYRLTLDWTEPGADGTRTVSLRVRDLAAGVDLNGGQPVLAVPVTAAEFAGNPARWLGTGCHATRGLLDNIRVEPPTYAGWATHRYPSLAGGPGGDDDQDGLTNAIEYACGLDPLRSDPGAGLPRPAFGTAAATVAFTPPPTLPGVLYQLDWSSDLQFWRTVTGTRTGGQLEFTIPTGGAPGFFLRHRVTLTD
jgi:hypothetical protein